MTVSEQCKTCNMPDSIQAFMDNLRNNGSSYREISRRLDEVHGIKIADTSVGNHYKTHRLFIQNLDASKIVIDPASLVYNGSSDNAIKIPKDWRPYAELKEDGTGTVTSTPQDDDSITDFSDILREMKVDPEAFEVVGNARIARWQSGDKWLTSYRVNIQKKSSNRDVLEELLPSISSVKPSGKMSEGDHAFVFVAGDLQLGKSDGDGTEGIVLRYRESLQKAVDKLTELDHMVGEVLISWVGDCIEGMVSQGGRNSRRTELTTTQQVRLLRKLMTETIKAFAPLSHKVTVVSVPGNHDEAQREPVSTDPSDSWAVDALVAVSEALEFNPEAFGHVDCRMVPFDEMTTSVDVAGTKITHAHGHQWKRGKHFEWWSGQHWGGHEPGKADILLAGHHHTGAYEQENFKYFIQTPSMEKESTWFRHRTGKIGNPSAVTFLTKGGDIKYLDFE